MCCLPLFSNLDVYLITVYTSHYTHIFANQKVARHVGSRVRFRSAISPTLLSSTIGAHADIISHGPQGGGWDPHGAGAMAAIEREFLNLEASQGGWHVLFQVFIESLVGP